MQWQPIETAPKDGTRILTFAPTRYEKQQTIAVVWWGEFWHEDYEPAGNGLFMQTRQLLRAEWEGGPWSPWRPTHWMPLPAPPKEQADNG